MFCQIIGNKEKEELFRTLVSEYGEGKWSSIAKALETQGITVKQSKRLRTLWNKLNPVGSHDQLNDEEVFSLMTIGIDCDSNTPQILEQWNRSHNQICNQTHLIYIYQKLIVSGIRKLSAMFTRKKTITYQYFLEMDRKLNTSIRSFLQITNLITDDPLIKQMQSSAEMIKQLLKAYGKNRTQDRGVQYAEYSKITNRQKFELAIEHFKYFDMLKKISKKKYHLDEQIVGLCKLQAPTIEENKKSALFQLRFMNQSWREMYQTVMKGNDELTTDYLVNPMETQGKNKKLSKGVQKYVKQVQKVNVTKITTLRGKILKPGKEYQPIQPSKFHNDLINELETSEQIGEDLEIQQFEALINKQHEMNQEIDCNPHMKTYIDNYLATAKKEAYKQFKQKQIKTQQ